MRSHQLLFVASLAVTGCGGATQGLNQTSITCPEGRTLLDGVCVDESVADYVACVRAQGATLGGAKHQEISADVGSLGVKAEASAELSEKLEKKYAASDAAMLEIVKRCNTVKASSETPSATQSPRPAQGAPLLHDVVVDKRSLRGGEKADVVVKFTLTGPGSGRILARTSVPGYGFTLDVAAYDSPKHFWVGCYADRPRHLVDWSLIVVDAQGRASAPFDMPVECRGSE